jgi:hypothetical protein
MSDVEKFIPMGVLANDGKNIIYKEMPNQIEKKPFSIELIENLKLKYYNKKYNYKDDPKLFLELLREYFASSLQFGEKFHPLYIGELEGKAEEVIDEVILELSLYGTAYITLEEVYKCLN